MSKVSKKIISGLNIYLDSLKSENKIQFDAEITIRQKMVIIKEKENIKIFPLKRKKK